MKSKIYITGAAGFIGFHTAKKFLDKGIKVHGFDSVNDYYDVNLKKSRLNDEKVVNPPKKPMVKNIFNCSLSKNFVVIK